MRTHSFREYVKDKDNIKAERLVFESLKDHFKPYTVEDVSQQHLAWDFVITHGDFITRVDAKFDANIGRSNRLPLELFKKYPNGRAMPEWGVNPSLDYVAVVPWTFTEVIMVPLPPLTRYALYKLATKGIKSLVEVENWKHWESWNPEGRYNTNGYAIPRNRFEAFIKEHPDEELLLTLPLDPVHHRDVPNLGRILINGVEQGPSLAKNRGLVSMPGGKGGHP